MNKNIKLIEKSRKRFDQQAADYDVSNEGEHARSLYQPLLEKLERLSYESVLDVGCGTGEILSKVTPQGNLTLAGIDLSPNMISIAQQKLGERADLRIGDAENLPWPDKSFDVVICLDSFHHYPNPRKALAEVRRVLRPDGQFILGDLWAPTPIRQFINLVIPFTRGGDVRVYSQIEICTLLDESGFKEIHWKAVGRNASVVTAQ